MDTCWCLCRCRCWWCWWCWWCWCLRSACVLHLALCPIAGPSQRHKERVREETSEGPGSVGRVQKAIVCTHMYVLHASWIMCRYPVSKSLRIGTCSLSARINELNWVRWGMLGLAQLPARATPVLVVEVRACSVLYCTDCTVHAPEVDQIG